MHYAHTSTLVRQFYDMEIGCFLKHMELIDIDDGSVAHVRSVFKEYHNVRNGIVFAVTKNFAGPNLARKPVVIGGPCISDCYETPTFEAAIDVLNVICAAKNLDAPGIVYIGVEEEQIKDSSKDWKRVGEQFSKFVRRLSGLLGYTGVEPIRTDSDCVKSAMDNCIPAIRDAFPDECLYDLYTFPPRSRAWSEKKSPEQCEIYRRNIATYVPSFVSEMTGSGMRQVIVVENSHQTNAVNAAIKFFQSQHRREYGPFQLVHLPVPDSMAKNRMYRSRMRYKLFIGQKRCRAKRRLLKSHPIALDYWFSAVPPEISKRVSNPGDFLSVLERIAGP